MALTILFYSVFSGLTAFASELWHVGVLRFLVAMGVGGEWAVGAALIAEVFPKHARERAGGLAHVLAGVGLGALVPACLVFAKLVQIDWRAHGLNFACLVRSEKGGCLPPCVCAQTPPPEDIFGNRKPISLLCFSVAENIPG